MGNHDIERRIQKGDFGAAAKLLTLIERRPIEARPILARLRTPKKPARIIGITGPPGVGKSSLVDRLTDRFRRRGQKIGILAVDPTSPLTGGAFLGDRVRMNAHFDDPGVFIRSLSARGAAGGLPILTILQASRVLEAVGLETIFVETIGAGQDQVGVMAAAHTVLLVLSPGGGDEVQVLKAGLMELADGFVINKSDLPGADVLARELTEVGFGERPRPVFSVSAKTQEGIESLAEWLIKPERLSDGQGHARLKLELLFQSVLLQRALARLNFPNLEALSRSGDSIGNPLAAAERLVERLIPKDARTRKAAPSRRTKR